MEGGRGRGRSGGRCEAEWPIQSRFLPPFSPRRSFTILKIFTRSLLVSWLLLFSFFFSPPPLPYVMKAIALPPSKPPSTFSPTASPLLSSSLLLSQHIRRWHRQIARLGRRSSPLQSFPGARSERWREGGEEREDEKLFCCNGEESGQ